ncbi:MAG: hypothetical protein MZV49_25460 [Rhodopseudomonas palustris]|nr:hypothetical protein [Rhodopseudomonas palustris]
MYQIVEVVQQLRGECGETQVDGAGIGMAQNIGGSGATILTHILKASETWQAHALAGWTIITKHFYYIIH